MGITAAMLGFLWTRAIIYVVLYFTRGTKVVKNIFLTLVRILVLDAIAAAVVFTLLFMYPTSEPIIISKRVIVIADKYIKLGFAPFSYTQNEHILRTNKNAKKVTRKVGEVVTGIASEVSASTNK